MSLQLLGYRYAGLQSGTECYCGQSYGALGESYDCDTNCPVGIVQLGMRYAEELHPTLFTKQTTSVREHLKLIILVFFSNLEFELKP